LLSYTGVRRTLNPPLFILAKFPLFPFHSRFKYYRRYFRPLFVFLYLCVFDLHKNDRSMAKYVTIL